MSSVVEVRAHERDGRSGPYYRGDRSWSPGWAEHVVDDDVLALISADPWLEVRVLDPRSQAAKKKAFASAASEEASAAEAHAKALRAKADALHSEADLAIEAIGSQPAPVAPAPATPFQDSMRAAMPASLLAQVDANEKSVAEAVSAARANSSKKK